MDKGAVWIAALPLLDLDLAVRWVEVFAIVTEGIELAAHDG